MPEFVKAAKVGDLQPGQTKVIEAGGKTLALCNVDGTYYALDNTCVHRGGPLGEGSLEGTTLTCPWHGWGYDVTSGTSTVNPAAKVSCFEIKLDGDDILVGV